MSTSGHGSCLRKTKQIREYQNSEKPALGALPNYPHPSQPQLKKVTFPLIIHSNSITYSHLCSRSIQRRPRLRYPLARPLVLWRPRSYLFPTPPARLLTSLRTFRDAPLDAKLNPRRPLSHRVWRPSRMLQLSRPRGRLRRVDGRWHVRWGAICIE